MVQATAKSHRSTLTLFHQWPRHHPSSGSSSSSPTSPTTPVSHSEKLHLQNHPVITPGTPESPSQRDPFNNNSTHPSPLIALPSNPSSRIHARPASSSTSASLSGRIARQASRPASEIQPSPLSPSSTTPKIILASPSTSTIHYLFPSETRSNLSTDRATRSAEGKVTRSGSVRRSNSAAGAQRERERKEDRHEQSENAPAAQYVPPRSNSDTRPINLAVERKIIERSFPLPPSRSCDSIKHLSTGAIGVSLSRPAKTAANPLGPAKRVVSSSGAPTTAKSTTKPPLRKSDISGPISVDPKSPAKSYGTMRTLRRQPSMADLGRGVARGLQVEVEDGDGRLGKASTMGRAGAMSVGRKGGMALSESWGNKGFGDGSVSPRTVEPHASSEIRITTIQPTPNARQLRRRSQSLTSPRPAPSPPSLSPMLPAPDFGNPLSLSDVIPSPSFSHLDYSTAGSTSAGPSRRSSNAIALFTKRASAIFPSSVPMERGTTRRGLGSYDSGKVKAREDAEKRLNGDLGGIARRMSQLGRSVSLRRKDESKPRPRSQSLSSRSVRDMGISPPVPPRSPHRDCPRRPSDPARGIYLGDLSVDLGGRFHTDDASAKTFYPNSPMSTDTTLYPSTSPSSGFAFLPAIDGMENDLTEMRVMGRPLHPAFAANASEISLLAPSTIGLGFSPIGTPVSLPSSLEAEAIDVTETGRRLSAHLSSPPPMPSLSSREASPGTSVPTGETSTRDDASSASRAALLSQNTYYIPPAHPKPALRATKSSGPGTMRRAYTSANLAPGADELVSASTNSGQSLVKSPSIVSKRSRSELRDTWTSTTRSKRPNTAFSLCSPPGAIDPLPTVDHPSPHTTGAAAPGTEPTRLRSKPSSPFLTASASLRVFFGRDGFVARSLSGAFDRDPRADPDVSESSLKSRISAPLGAGGRDGTMSRKGAAKVGNVEEKVQQRDQAWRRDVLSQAVSLSISSSLNRLSNLADNGEGSEPKMVSSSSRPRLGIPAELLAAGEGTSADADSKRGSGGNGTERQKDAHNGGNGGHLPTVKVDRLGQRRTVEQMGRDDSMASASVYSNYAPTAKHSPRARHHSPDPPEQDEPISRWSPSPVKISKKSRDQPRAKPTISSPLPLFTPAHPSRLGLAALEPITSPPTDTPTPSPAPTVVDEDHSASVTLRSPPGLIGKSPSGKKSRLMSIIRRHPDAPSRRPEVDTSRLTSPPPPPSLTSPSSLSLSLLRSPKSVGSRVMRIDTAPRGISSEMVRNGEVVVGQFDHAMAMQETGQKHAASMAHGHDAEMGGQDGRQARGVLDELVARDDEASDKERAKEEKMRKVLNWRKGVGSGTEDEGVRV